MDATYLIPGGESNSYNQAMSCPDTSFWEDAKAHELSQIMKLGTYKFVPLPPGHSAIGSKWVYKIKQNREKSAYPKEMTISPWTQKTSNIRNSAACSNRISSISNWWFYISFCSIFFWNICTCCLNQVCPNPTFHCSIAGLGKPSDSTFLNSELPNGENIYLKSLQVMSSRERETMSGFLSECSMA